MISTTIYWSEKVSVCNDKGDGDDEETQYVSEYGVIGDGGGGDGGGDGSGDGGDGRGDDEEAGQCISVDGTMGGW